MGNGGSHKPQPQTKDTKEASKQASTSGSKGTKK